METLSQARLEDLTESLKVFKFLPMVLNVLMLGFFYISRDFRENAKVARVGLAVQVLVSAWIYAGWIGIALNVVLAGFMLLDWQEVLDLRVRTSAKYFGLTFSWTLALGVVALNLAFALPQGNFVSAPHMVAALVFWIWTRFLVIFDRECDRDVAYGHFVTVKYFCVALCLGQSALVCYEDWKIYPDHIIALFLICIGMFHKDNCVEVYEEIKPKLKRIKNPNYERMFEVRPSCDGGEQGKSPLPYYMDEDGDIANEFYEEVNKRSVKVSIEKLKLV